MTTKTPLFRGSCCALLTPFYEDGSLNLPLMAKLIQRQLDGGTAALVVAGTTGEAATLKEAELEELLRFCVKETAGRVPLLAGAGSNDTAHGVELCQLARDCGADGLLCVTPYYNKSSQRGLFRHFSALADATQLPLLLYNVPSRCGCDLQAETVAELATLPNIVGIKEAGTSLSRVGDILRATADSGFAVYSGNDDLTLPLLSLGGSGVISVLANLLPEQSSRLCSLWFDGQWEESRRLQLELLPLIHALFSSVNPMPLKEAMKLLGWDCGPCRLPLCSIEDGEREQLRRCLADYGLLPGGA